MCKIKDSTSCHSFEPNCELSNLQYCVCLCGPVVSESSNFSVDTIHNKSLSNIYNFTTECVHLNFELVVVAAPI